MTGWQEGMAIDSVDVSEPLDKISLVNFCSTEFLAAEISINVVPILEHTYSKYYENSDETRDYGFKVLDLLVRFGSIGLGLCVLFLAILHTSASPPRQYGTICPSVDRQTSERQ